MTLIVQKFGGTSVGTLERIQHVAKHIIRSKKQGYDLVVVVSAMAGETDRLIQLAHSIHPAPEPREYAVLLATGEQTTIALLAIMLNAYGCPARSYTGHQLSIRTDGDFKKARILQVECEKIRRDLSEDKVVIVAGFQGVDEYGNITTLGRGGSDTTAVAVAAALQATECQIYTDVDGVYTTDPHVVPEARRLDHITFEEMLEMASLGAKVLQIRAVEFAGKYRIPLRVLSSFTGGPGTLITHEEIGMEQAIVSGIAFNKNEAKLSLLGVPNQIGMAYHILGPISEANIEVDVIVQNVGAHGMTDFTFTVHRDDYYQAREILESIAKKLKANEVQGDMKIAKLSIIGVGMRSHAGVASKMFKALGAEGINIQLITTSEIKVSVIVDEKYLELGVRALHTTFCLDRTAIEEYDPKDHVMPA